MGWRKDKKGVSLKEQDALSTSTASVVIFCSPGDGSVGEGLPHMHVDLSSDLQNSHKARHSSTYSSDAPRERWQAETRESSEATEPGVCSHKEKERP